MQKYRDIDNDSGVDSFHIEPTLIKVWFKKSRQAYTYTYQSAGQFHVEEMKKLALAGNGLNSYIQRYTKNLYEK